MQPVIGTSLGGVCDLDAGLLSSSLLLCPGLQALGLALLHALQHTQTVSALQGFKTVYSVASCVGRSISFGLASMLHAARKQCIGSSYRQGATDSYNMSE